MLEHARNLLFTMDRIEADDGVGAVVVTGAPPAFCAGGSVYDLLNPRASLRDMYAGVLALSRTTLLEDAAMEVIVSVKGDFGSDPVPTTFKVDQVVLYFFYDIDVAILVVEIVGEKLALSRAKLCLSL